MLIPLSAPEIQSVYHGDFTPVTAASPARPGELLIVAATGLGPTRPGTDPGASFAAPPLAQVNSPVDVTAAGRPVEVVNKLGWPGTKDLYRVDFRVPSDVSGEVPVRLSAAWITGPEFRIPVR
jgi:uncharacterized protein (TIGR03437 family)